MSTFKETLNQVGCFQMFFTSKIFSNEIPRGAPVFKKGRQNRHSSGRMGTGPPLVPWHLPECPIEPSGPQIPVCHQPCPALTFYKATSKNPVSSQNPFFLFLVFPAIPMEAASSICGPGALVSPLGHVTQAGHTCPAIHNSRYNALGPQPGPQILLTSRHCSCLWQGDHPRLPPPLTWATGRSRAAEVTLATPQNTPRQHSEGDTCPHSQLV